MIVVGTSGWDYRHWDGSFYPPGVRGIERLSYLAQRLGSVELNGTFYSLQRPASYQRWVAATPAGFLFAVKGNRWTTHMKKLLDPDVTVANFLASGVLALDRKLGPIVWQLPQVVRYDRVRLATFLRVLPHTLAAAVDLARNHHDDKLRWEPWLTVSGDGPMRHALEVRHESFAGNAEFLALLRDHDVALVVAETAGTWPLLLADPASYVYVRLHGSGELYASDYTSAELAAWAGRIRGWADVGKDVYVYFDNDARGFAAHNAIELQELVAG